MVAFAHPLPSLRKLASGDCNRHRGPGRGEWRRGDHELGAISFGRAVLMQLADVQFLRRRESLVEALVSVSIRSES